MAHSSAWAMNCLARSLPAFTEQVSGGRKLKVIKLIKPLLALQLQNCSKILRRFKNCAFTKTKPKHPQLNQGEPFPPVVLYMAQLNSDGKDGAGCPLFSLSPVLNTGLAGVISASHFDLTLCWEVGATANALTG